jgi:hypothetical protein
MLKPPSFGRQKAIPRQESPMDVSIGEVLYLVLVIAVAWWAYAMLKEHL